MGMKEDGACPYIRYFAKLFQGIAASGAPGNDK